MRNGVRRHTKEENIVSEDVIVDGRCLNARAVGVTFKVEFVGVLSVKVVAVKMMVTVMIMVLLIFPHRTLHPATSQPYPFRCERSGSRHGQYSLVPLRNCLCSCPSFRRVFRP